MNAEQKHAAEIEHRLSDAIAYLTEDSESFRDLHYEVVGNRLVVAFIDDGEAKMMVYDCDRLREIDEMARMDVNDIKCELRSDDVLREFNEEDERRMLHDSYETRDIGMPMCDGGTMT